MAQNLQEDGADREPRSEKPELDAFARARNKRPNRKSQQDDKPFPIIRKPVPISKSGPLRAPKPGSPVKPPSVLTNRVPPTQPDIDLHLTELTGDSANLDFLDLDEGNSWVSQSGADGDQQFYQELNARESRRPQMWLLGIAALLAAGLGYFLYPHWQARQSAASLEEPVMPPAEQLAESERDDSALAETSVGEADNPVVLAEQDAPDLSSPTNVVNEFEAARPLNVRFREQLARLESLVAEGEIAQAEEVLKGMDRTLYGYGAPEFSLIEARIEAAKPEIVRRETERAAAEGEADALVDLQQSERLAQEQAARELAEQQESERLAQEQAERELAEQQEAERLAREQAELEQQRLAQEQAARELAEQQEAERLAREQAELEAQRLAQEQAARELAEQQEAERLAQEQAELEAQRLAQEQAARELAELQEAERLAQEQAARELAEQQEAQRLVQEQSAREQAEQQEAERVAQEQAEQLLAAERAFQERILRRQELERVAALAEQTRADRATQELARQEQLLRAQEALQSEDSSQIALIQAAPESVKPVINSIQAVDPVVENPVPQSISDEELQSVYQRFDQLQKAIRDRDIQAVIKLTDRSVVKIQQFQQIFLNNVSIDARIKNVSTRDARGEVEGTLVITRLERADGVVTGPPVDLSSVKLTSKRNEDGWSAIQW